MTANGLQQTVRTIGKPALDALDGIDVDHQPSPDPQLNDALETLVQLRDALIERHREGEDCEPWLGRINGMLSGLFAVEYPPGGIQWQRIRNSRDELRDMLGSLEETGQY